VGSRESLDLREPPIWTAWTWSAILSRSAQMKSFWSGALGRPMSERPGRWPVTARAGL